MVPRPVETLLKLLLIAVLLGCTSPNSTGKAADFANTSANEQSETSALATSKPPQVNSFTLDELFEQGAGGCGMSLLKPGAAPGEGFLFTHGMDAEPALMKIDGAWVWFQRTAASGERFYGQTTSQTFSNDDGSLIVETEVTLGEEGEIESVEFSDAVLRLTYDGQTIEIDVEGGAGC